MTKRGVYAVVVMSAAEFERLTALDTAPKRTLIDQIMNAPKLPEGLDDIFDDRHAHPSEYRDIDLG